MCDLKKILFAALLAALLWHYWSARSEQPAPGVLAAAVPEQVLQLAGKLVRVDAPDGWHWQSSLTREDTGHGSCELVYVESVIVR